MTARWPRLVVAAVALALVATGCLPDHPGAPYDFDGDGRADYVWVDQAGVWYSLTQPDTPLWSSTDTRVSYVPGDYDGDGRMEPAAIDGDGNWATAGGAGTIVFPAPDWPEDISPIDGRIFVLPVPGRYDGGLRDLPAWYRDLDGTWFIQGQDPIQFGDGPTDPDAEHDIASIDQDFPVPADYDGDGVTDLAVYNPRTGRYRIRSSIDLTVSERTLLPTNDGDRLILPVPADYDGVGHAQAAVWGSITGWAIDGRDEVDPFGIPPHSWEPPDPDDYPMPVPADYDGDGRTDLAVLWSDGTWHVRQLWTPVTVPDPWHTQVPVAMPAPVLWNIARFTFVGVILNEPDCSC